MRNVRVAYIRVGVDSHKELAQMRLGFTLRLTLAAAIAAISPAEKADKLVGIHLEQIARLLLHAASRRTPPPRHLLKRLLGARQWRKRGGSLVRVGAVGEGEA